MIKDISKKNIKQKKMLVSRNLIDDTKKDLQLFNVNCIGIHTNKEGQAYFLNKKRLAGDVKTYEIKAFDTKISFNMKYCPKGSFERGLDEKESKVQKKCQMKQGFWISESLVTVDLFLMVMGWIDKEHYDNKNPKTIVEGLTWYTCIDFCNKLSKLLGFEPCYIVDGIKPYSIKDFRYPQIKESKVSLNVGANGFRLPTQTEWEYAAKANQSFKFAGSDDLNEVCQHNGAYSDALGLQRKELVKPNNQKEKTPKQFKPNAWGIYDMNGFTQWCVDNYIKADDPKHNEQFYYPKYFVSEAYNKPYDRKSMIDPFLFFDNEISLREARGGSPLKSCDRPDFLNGHRRGLVGANAEGSIRLVRNDLPK